MTDDPHFSELRLKRLRFRAAHRGFKEADIILGLFAETEGANLGDADLDAFEVLLQEPDADIYAWVTGAAPAPPVFDTPVLARIKAFVPEAHLRLRAKL